MPLPLWNLRNGFESLVDVYLLECCIAVQVGDLFCTETKDPPYSNTYYKINVI